MTEDDRRPFFEMLAAVATMKRGELTETIGEIWWQALKGFSFELVRKGFNAHIVDPKAGSYMPMPADIIRHINGTHEDRSLLAWGKVFEAVQRIGPYPTVVFDDPAIHATIVDMGGWQQLCAIRTEELPFVAKRFADTYAAYTRKAGFDYPRMLPGITDTVNKAAGAGDAVTLRLIGDPEKARRVYEEGAEGGKTMFTLAAAIADTSHRLQWSPTP